MVAPVNVQDFLRSIGGGPPPPVVLFCPAKAPRARDATYEPLLAERAIGRLVETYVDPGMKDLAYTAFYADEARCTEIVQEARTVPFLAERRVVLVHNAERYNADSSADPLIEYIEAPCEFALLILAACHIDKRTRFYRSCEKNGVVVECPQLGERDAMIWARAEVESRHKKIEHDALKEIVRRAGVHLSDVHNALTIVMAYVGDAPVIRVDDVVAACADVAEEKIWALTDGIAANQPGEALTALRGLIDMGKHEDEIIGTINWLLKSAYAVAQAGSSPPSISAYVAKNVRPLADKLGMQKLRDAFVLCTDTQFMMRSTGVDRFLALELLVVKLAAPVRRPQTLAPSP